MSIIESLFRIEEAKGTLQVTTVVIWFDGGTTCNVPKWGLGKDYGSYRIDEGEIVRVEFGAGHSNNSGEIRTLVKAIEAVLLDHNPRFTKLIIHGDSQIALGWAERRGEPRNYKRKKKWNAPTDNFLEATQLLKNCISPFKSITTLWHPREESVKLFGH